MFERYDGHARQVIFVARYEASHCGASVVKGEHLLVGLVVEDEVLQSNLPPKAAEAIFRQVRGRADGAERISTSVDLPLDDDARRLLAFAAEEATKLSHANVTCGHLVLGVLRLEKAFAAELLNQYGISYDTYREIVREYGERISHR